MILIDSDSPVASSVTHIREMTQGNINNAAKDRFPLWNDVSNNNLNKPFYHGVVGPRWRPISAEINNGKNIISSPMPKPENYERVIANEYPDKTFSRSYFDAPLRKDVQQINIPNAITRVTTERFDPRIPLKQEVEKIDGTLIHGTGSTVERIVTGQPSFLEKSGKKFAKHHKARKVAKSHRSHQNEVDTLSDARSSAGFGLAQANAVYNRASENLGILKNGVAPSNTNKLYSHFERGTDMIIPIQMANKYERQSLLLNDDAEGRQARIWICQCA